MEWGGTIAKRGRIYDLVHHLLPAARGYVLTQASLLLPRIHPCRGDKSYVGLGFQGDVATWGTMLHDASNVALLGDAPWTLAPAKGARRKTFSQRHRRAASE